MEIDGFLNLVKRRRSIRQFKPDAIPEEYIEKMLEAARWAMSGANGQPWEFVVVKNPESRVRIADVVADEWRPTRQIEMGRVEELRHPGVVRDIKRPLGFESAPVIIVVCADPRTLQATVLADRFFSNEHETFHIRRDSP